MGICGATCLRDVTDTVQTVQYSDSQCTVHMYTAAPETAPEKTPQHVSHKIFTTTKPITFNFSLVAFQPGVLKNLEFLKNLKFLKPAFFLLVEHIMRFLNWPIKNSVVF